MSVDEYHFVEWKEQFISLERGNRVVHYFLKGSSGETVLAIIGTERSVRHMFYIVADDFVKAFGSQTKIHAGYKWRSRREVVDWLTSMISRQHESSAFSLGNLEFSVNGSGFPQSDSQGHLPRILNGNRSEIVWSGNAWICGKQLRHYPSFSRNGITIAVHSFVFVMGKGENHYLAYLDDMYEDRRGQKKVLSAECVDGPATILSREHFHKCSTALSHALPSKVHMCFRQFRNNRVKSFDLTKLRGYFNQPILSCLFTSPMQKPDSDWSSLNGDEDDELTLGSDVKVGEKRSRRGSECTTSQITCGGVNPVGRQFLDFTLGIGNNKQRISDSLLARSLLSLRHMESHPSLPKWLRVGEKIELLCQDSGIRGCWFQCTILQVAHKQLKVRYDYVKDEDGTGNLEEWIPALKAALPDKLGTRFFSRLTVRPNPPKVDHTEHSVDIGVAVDAWWSDGWWEGVVIGVNNSADDHLQIYFPGESLFMSFHMKDLRVSRDWVGDHWTDIGIKRDILYVITSTITAESRHSSHSTGVKDGQPHGITALETDVTGGTDVREVRVNGTPADGLSSMQSPG
ncbi:hypothetical protein MLD38_024898 [Melastoma candidum]|uniref:Uncharacterized protein n=1 Tax=Melastoma candidum TaxID=119954 RepID=A0ACB9NUN9_9MYRT|nr:hypothetical protein MLD38_024898 [Melastoma candidum]